MRRLITGVAIGPGALAAPPAARVPPRGAPAPMGSAAGTASAGATSMLIVESPWVRTTTGAKDEHDRSLHDHRQLR